MGHPIISMIVPVYNAEEDLRRCVDSLLRQGLDSDELEIILVNDGSKDKSLDICNEYAEKHENIMVISQENSGVSIARNNGIDNANGTYIGFIDSDDYFLDNGLSLAYNHYRDRADVDVIHYFSSYDFWPKNPIDDTPSFDGTGHENIMQGGLPSFCWLCLYKKEFLDRHNIRFKPYVVGEDQLFSSTVYLVNPRLVSTKADIYRYVVKEGSATTKRSKSHCKRCVDDYLNAYKDILDCMHENIKGNDELYDVCCRSLNSKKMFGFSRMLSADYSLKEFAQVSKKCKEIGFYPVQAFSPSLRSRISVAIMNAVMNNGLLYPLASIMFRTVIEGMVLPVIRTRFKK